VCAHSGGGGGTAPARSTTSHSRTVPEGSLRSQRRYPSPFVLGLRSATRALSHRALHSELLAAPRQDGRTARKRGARGRCARPGRAQLEDRRSDLRLDRKPYRPGANLVTQHPETTSHFRHLKLERCWQFLPSKQTCQPTDDTASYRPPCGRQYNCSIVEPRRDSRYRVGDRLHV
jgi:hypothetical protein